jgi:transposase
LVDANRDTVARLAGGIRQVELDLSAVSSMGRQRHLGRDPGRACWKRIVRRHAADDRCDHHPGASLRGRRKRGPERNALGRSRGGFSTKINARTNSEGLPIGVVITPGQAHDVTAFPALMQEIDCDPDQMLGDKGYDSEAVRDEIQQRGGEAAIPSTATRKIQHTVDKAVYALRNRIERFFNRAKNSRRVATRYDKLIESFAAFVLLACIRIWLKFVHMA